MADNVCLTIMQLYTEVTTEETGLRETNLGKEHKVRIENIES